MTKLPFKPRARLLLQLGEQLIRNENIALLELVKNSYDADASSVTVTMKSIDDKRYGQIVILDDGTGMDVDTIRDVWMEPGSDYKEKLFASGKRSPQFKRLPLGEKGIGRFGAHRLGQRIELVTRKKGCDEVFLKIDWSEFRHEKYLEDVPVRIVERNPEVFVGNKTGTRIIITDLRTPWDRAMVRETQRSMTSLCSPFDTPDAFTADLKLDKKEWLDGLFTWKSAKEGALFKVSCTMEGNLITRFSYRFIPWPAMSKLQSRHLTLEDSVLRKQVRMVKKDNSKIDLGEYKIGPVKFSAYIFDRESRILELGVQDRRGLKDYLDANGGIRVYRDGIRVYDYGEPGNDWLSLGVRRVNVPTKRVSNNLILGAVQLNRESSSDLAEKTNREGFIENKAYETLQESILYVLGVVETLRNSDKEKIRLLYGPSHKSEPVLSTIEDLRKMVQKKIHEPALKDEIGSYLERIEKDYRYINETLLKSASAGLSLGVVIHEADKIMAELTRVIKSERPSRRIAALAQRLSHLLEGYSLVIRSKGKESADLKELLRQSLFNVEFRLDAHGIEIEDAYSRFQGDSNVRCASNLVIGALINLLDNSIWWLEYGKRPRKKIYVGLQKEPKGHLSVIFADNGPGFSLPTDELAKPFVSTKPGGMGLGLHIAREIMEAHGGRLIFPESRDYDLPREFRDGAILALAFKRPG